MLVKVLVELFNLIIKAFGSVAGILVSLLPSSPFLFVQDIDIPFLDTLNWVFPVNFFVTILGYWVGSIALYYVIQVALRWIKVIQ